VRTITADQIDRILTYPALVDALREAFKADIAAPIRHHHTVKQPGADATLLLMPAWTTGAQGGEQFLGTKIVTVFPDNGKLSKPAVLGSYILMSGATGERSPSWTAPR
jgi:ornithine cyclodeaminase/alanine dehydrogenase-like protein (mu-crystallin family)